MNTLSSGKLKQSPFNVPFWRLRILLNCLNNTLLCSIRVVNSRSGTKQILKQQAVLSICHYITGCPTTQTIAERVSQYLAHLYTFAHWIVQPAAGSPTSSSLVESERTGAWLGDGLMCPGLLRWFANRHVRLFLGPVFEATSPTGLYSSGVDPVDLVDVQVAQGRSPLPQLEGRCPMPTVGTCQSCSRYLAGSRCKGSL